MFFYTTNLLIYNNFMRQLLKDICAHPKMYISEVYMIKSITIVKKMKINNQRNQSQQILLC